MSKPPKQPINRKILWLVLIAVLVIGVLGVIALFIQDPRRKQATDAEAKRLEQIKQQPTGSVEGGQAKVKEEEKSAARKVAEKGDPEREIFDKYVNGVAGGGKSRSKESKSEIPDFDPKLLEELERAQQEVASRPTLRSDSASSDSLFPPAGGGEQSRSSKWNGSGEKKSSFLTYENYKKASGNGESGSLFGGSSGGDNEGKKENTYETLKPASPPSARIVEQGVGIPTILITRIDTRNPGAIKAQVTRTIYDSRTQHIPLIPRGSFLLGSYSSGAAAGTDRVHVEMSRLVLPDGRAVELPKFPAAGADGTAGVEGKYKSNLLRAIGPTFAVAVLSQVVDRQLVRSIDTDESMPTNTLGNVSQSKTILQETMPKVNEVVMQRGQGAQPYFIVKQGVEMRVVLTADLEIPQGASDR